MKATVGYARGRQTPVDRDRRFKEGITRIPVQVVCEDGILRVRVVKTSVDLTLGARGSLVETSEYLDGLIEHDTFNRDRIVSKERSMVSPREVGVARTKETADYGRLKQACAQTVDLASRVLRQGEMSPEQSESLILNLQSIRAWRKVTDEMHTDAGGQVDLVEDLMKRIFGDA